MIYTVTCNPSLDYIVTVHNFQEGAVNRTEQERILPGGKGINVALVLENLGVPATVLGFAAGFAGEEIQRLLRERGCREALIPLKSGCSRINLKLHLGKESEINGRGPRIPEQAVVQLWERLEELQSGDQLVLAGTIPDSLPTTFYRDLAVAMKKKGVPVVVDAAGDLLARALEGEPFLIKPNQTELEELLGYPMEHTREVVAGAKRLQRRGARNVLVSRDRKGAVLVTEQGKVLVAAAPKGRVIHSVGAGDSMVAGFLAEYSDSGDFERAFCKGIAAGSASVFSEELAKRQEVEALLPLVILENEI